MAAFNLSLGAGCTTPVAQVGSAARDEEGIRAAERARLQALVAADMTTAARLHAEDFKVINPLGRLLSREAYLGSVASGESDYLTWQPEDIEVRLRGSIAAIRYRSRVEMSMRGQRLPAMLAWNTGVYERRDGRWLIVWYQVTQIVHPSR